MSEDRERLCPYCRTPLYYQIEVETNCCDSCADKLSQQYQERREWDYYHPFNEGDEP